VPREAKLVIYVGHDTNLANIGAMLGVHWELKTYLPDETPPAGAMAFELLRGTAASQYPGQYFVRMAYYSQTLDQMRNATLLSPKQPPDRALIVLPCAAGKAPDGACPWPEFYAQVKPTLDPDPDCVKPH